jgi:hypothetical protein
MAVDAALWLILAGMTGWVALGSLIQIKVGHAYDTYD